MNNKIYIKKIKREERRKSKKKGENTLIESKAFLQEETLRPVHHTKSSNDAGPYNSKYHFVNSIIAFSFSIFSAFSFSFFQIIIIVILRKRIRLGQIILRYFAKEHYYSSFLSSSFHLFWLGPQRHRSRVCLLGKDASSLVPYFKKQYLTTNEKRN